MTNDDGILCNIRHAIAHMHIHTHLKYFRRAKKSTPKYLMYFIRCATFHVSIVYCKKLKEIAIKQTQFPS